MFNIGFIACIFSSIAFIPQFIYIYNSNDTESLSIYSLIIFSLSQLFWFIHSFQTMDFALIISPIINIMIYSYFIFKKYKNELK